MFLYGSNYCLQGGKDLSHVWKSHNSKETGRPLSLSSKRLVAFPILDKCFQKWIFFRKQPKH